MLCYILLLYYIVEYTLRTNNGIIFIIFISFILFIYTFYCYSFITRLFAFVSVVTLSVTLSVTSISLSGYQVIRLPGYQVCRLHCFPLQFIATLHRYCSSFAPAFRYATFICFLLPAFVLLPAFLRNKKEAKKKEVYYILYLYYIFFLCILVIFLSFGSFLSFYYSLFLSCFCMYVFVCSKSMFYNT